jgi:hypothetical protein
VKSSREGWEAVIFACRRGLVASNFFDSAAMEYLMLVQWFNRGFMAAGAQDGNAPRLLLAQRSWLLVGLDFNCIQMMSACHDG